VQRLPSASTVRQVLKRDFKLRYRRTNAASAKYNDTDFDEKRRWVSRLLAQFLMADVLVVSIDECSFKQEGVPLRCWQSDSATLRRLFEPPDEASTEKPLPSPVSCQNTPATSADVPRLARLLARP
jgi:hypothetical protein